MNIFKKLLSIELRFVIWVLLGTQIIMFSLMVYNKEAFDAFHITLEPLHSKLVFHIESLPLWQASLLISFWTVVLIIIITLIIGYFYEARQRSLLKSSLQHAELMALKARIQPHFLFNTLNTIIYLIRENETKAIDTTRRLADLYRFILKSSESATNSLKEELECVERYLLIEQERFGGRLQFEIKLPDEWMTRDVPSLILQPLIENCINHGLADYTDKGKIEITLEKKQTKISLVVTDNGIGIGALKLKNLLRSEGHGLKNVNERWNLFTGNPLRIESELDRGTRCFLDWE